MKSTEKWGVDVDTAVELALKDLKLSRDEVEIEVLEESSSGFLGIGSKLAKVRVTAKDSVGSVVKEKATFDDIDAILAGLPENATKELPEEVRADYDKFEKEEREDARAREKAQAREKKAHNKKKYELSLEDTMLYEVKKLDPVNDHPIEAFLKEVAEKMGIEVDFSVKASKDLVFVEITGKDTGVMIGKRGATLDAIQCLASYVVNKDESKYVRVIIDAENYRERREKTLVNLANRLADKVDRTKHSVTLEPMNPYERKVIHCTLQNHPRVKTRSEGKDPYRKVVIERK